MNLGICLQGCEDQFERALLERAKEGKPFVYGEIGVAHCDTWISVCQLLATTGAQWRSWGVDPWVHAFEAYQKKISPYFKPDKALLLVQTREEAFATEKERIGTRLDFVFIDGCHAKPCVMGDFLAVEPLVVPGGLVVFHDIDLPGGNQGHCKTGADVQSGLAELGLTTETCGDCDPCIGGRSDQCAISPSRKGWRRLSDWTCDKTKNAFSCGVFLKL